MAGAPSEKLPTPQSVVQPSRGQFPLPPGDLSVESETRAAESEVGADEPTELNPGQALLQALLDPTAVIETDPVWQGVRMSSALYKPRQWTPQEIIRFQRSLFESGYISEAEFDKMVPGDYDVATRRAYAEVYSDAVQRGMSVGDLVTTRIALKRGKSVKDVLGGGELDEDTHRRNLTEDYISYWGENPPPGKIDASLGLNRAEFAFIELANNAWQDSGVAKARADELNANLEGWLRGTGEFSGSTTSAPALAQSNVEYSVSELMKILLDAGAFGPGGKNVSRGAEMIFPGEVGAEPETIGGIGQSGFTPEQESEMQRTLKIGGGAGDIARAAQGIPPEQALGYQKGS